MCLKLLLIFAVSGYCIAAPKPIQWDELGTKIQNFGERAIPAIRRACGVLASPQSGYPQVQGYYYPPVQSYYPQYQGRGYPQSPNFPISPSRNYYPQFGNNFPPNNLLPVTPEQKDLNRGVEKPKLPRIPPYIPPSEENAFDSESEEDFDDNAIPDTN